MNASNAKPSNRSAVASFSDKCAVCLIDASLTARGTLGDANPKTSLASTPLRIVTGNVVGDAVTYVAPPIIIVVFVFDAVGRQPNVEALKQAIDFVKDDLFIFVVPNPDIGNGRVYDGSSQPTSGLESPAWGLAAIQGYTAAVLYDAQQTGWVLFRTPTELMPSRSTMPDGGRQS